MLYIYNHWGLKTFIENFKPLYDRGVRSATIPFTHWMLTGEIQQNFPDLFVKNTILNNVSEPREIAQLAEAGFKYINLDRVLMRDHSRLKTLREVADKYNVKLSLLANEGCKGGCNVMDEHFTYNNTRKDNDVPYFVNEISRVSCPLWDNNDEAIILKTANFTPWREDWVEMLDYIDVIKMHGRESITRINETMEIISNFALNKEHVYNGFKQYQIDINPKAFDFWRNKIKTCEFNCFECNSCDNLHKTFNKTDKNKQKMLSNALLNSYINQLNDNNYGRQLNTLINEISKKSNKYLEIGSKDGKTTCIVMKHINDIIIYDDYRDNPNLKEKLKSNILKNKKSHNIILYDTNNFNDIDIPDTGGIDFVLIDMKLINPYIFFNKNKTILNDECVFIVTNIDHMIEQFIKIDEVSYYKVMESKTNYAIILLKQSAKFLTKRR